VHIRITKAGFVVKLIFYAGTAISGRFESACGRLEDLFDELVILDEIRLIG
jgi:hypothetical protein